MQRGEKKLRAFLRVKVGERGRW